MARTLRDAKLDSRTARAKLIRRREPYWSQIAPGCHLGYRKGAVGSGAWIAKWRDPLSAQRRMRALGAADDVMEADGVTALSFPQAQQRAHAWFSDCASSDTGSENRNATVNQALDDYLEWFRHNRKSYLATSRVLEAHIRPKFGRLRIDQLTARQFRKWHAELAATPARRRRKKGVEPPTEAIGHDPERARRRKVTANRILVIFKAALNHAYREGMVSRDDAWRRVRGFRGVDAARVRHLNEDECRQLVNASQGGFRTLVQGALLTGCRYGELVELRVGDVSLGSGTILIRDSKSSRSRHVYLTDEGVRLFGALIAGRQAEARVFLRDDGKLWSKNHQERPIKDACVAARIEPAISFHILRHTYASILAMRGTPLQVIAHNLGHADTRMVEKHYGHLAPNYIAETIRARFPVLGVLEEPRVVAI